MYHEMTRNIAVTVEPTYLDEESSPENSRFVWSYHVRISNEGAETVQLRDRYWRIMDARGRVQEVRGVGVVGEQPVLGPGASYTYTSGAPLSTPSGIMSGTYRMETADGESFEVVIPAFSLDSPHQAARLN